MGNFDDLVKRLRARADHSANRENSLDWKAADAIEHLWAKSEDLEAENKRLASERQPPQQSDSEPAPRSGDRATPETSEAQTRALGLKEAAALLGISYSTVYEHKESMGFFKVGSQWRIWPDRLRHPPRVATAKPQVDHDQAPKAVVRDKSVAASLQSMSARQVSAELDKLLAQPPKRRPKRGAPK